MSQLTMKATLIALGLLAIKATAALKCYTCDNGAWGDQCVNNPGSIPNGFITCEPPRDEYCFTRRLEEDGGSSTTLSNVLKWLNLFQKLR